MKVILLMGFALCFGMSGFGMEETVTGADGLGSGLGKARLYEKRKTSMGAPLNAVEDPLPTKKAKTENSPEIGSSQGIRYSPTRITEEPTSPQRGFSVDRNQASREAHKSYNQFMQKVRKTLGPLLDSETEPTENNIREAVRTIVRNSESNDRFLAYQRIDSVLRSQFDYGLPSTIARAQEILNFLNSLPSETFSSETSEEE